MRLSEYELVDTVQSGGGSDADRVIFSQFSPNINTFFPMYDVNLRTWQTIRLDAVKLRHLKFHSNLLLDKVRQMTGQRFYDFLLKSATPFNTQPSLCSNDDDLTIRRTVVQQYHRYQP